MEKTATKPINETTGTGESKETIHHHVEEVAVVANGLQEALDTLERRLTGVLRPAADDCGLAWKEVVQEGDSAISVNLRGYTQSIKQQLHRLDDLTSRIDL